MNQIQEVDYKARHCGENNYIDTLSTVSRSSWVHWCSTRAVYFACDKLFVGLIFSFSNSWGSTGHRGEKGTQSKVCFSLLDYQNRNLPQIYIHIYEPFLYSGNNPQKQNKILQVYQRLITIGKKKITPPVVSDLTVMVMHTCCWCCCIRENWFSSCSSICTWGGLRFARLVRKCSRSCASHKGFALRWMAIKEKYQARHKYTRRTWHS